MKMIDLTGQRLPDSRWTVIARAENTPGGQAQWRCRCTCGTEKVVKSIMLRRKLSRSCGCLQREWLAAQSRNKHVTVHNHARRGLHSKAYKAWVNMRARCRGSCNRPEFYAGRGIAVDQSWDSFENFLADMGNPPPGMTLDRIDNNGNYSKENCRWVGWGVQARNKRGIFWVEIHGERLPLKDVVAKYSQLSYTGVRKRIDTGWSLLDAILLPKGSRKPQIP